MLCTADSVTRRHYCGRPSISTPNDASILPIFSIYMPKIKLSASSRLFFATVMREHAGVLEISCCPGRGADVSSADPCILAAFSRNIWITTPIQEYCTVSTCLQAFLNLYRICSDPCNVVTCKLQETMTVRRFHVIRTSRVYQCICEFKIKCVERFYI